MFRLPFSTIGRGVAARAEITVPSYHGWTARRDGAARLSRMRHLRVAEVRELYGKSRGPISLPHWPGIKYGQSHLRS